MVLILKDITEQYQLRESIRSSQHLLQSLEVTNPAIIDTRSDSYRTSAKFTF